MQSTVTETKLLEEQGRPEKTCRSEQTKEKRQPEPGQLSPAEKLTLKRITDRNKTSNNKAAA